MVLHSTRELDEGMSGKVISGIGGSFCRNTHYVAWRAKRELKILKIADIMGNIGHAGGLRDARNWRTTFAGTLPGRKLLTP